MAVLPGIRVRNNGVVGTVTDNPLTIGATTFNSLNLSKLGVVLNDHAIITLDPLRQYGEPEIVMVTTHTVDATVATIQRGMYGTPARAHPAGTLWVHAAVSNDFIEIVTSTTRPADPYEGQVIYETDTGLYKSFNGTSWAGFGSGGAGVSDHGDLSGLADDDHTQYQLRSEKGVANGYAGLDVTGVVPLAQLPTTIATDGEVATAITNHEAAADPHPVYQRESEKGAASGYAGLNSSSVVVPGQVAAGTMDGSGVFVRGTDTGTQQWSPILESDIPAAIARDSEVTTAVANHAGAADPHTGYQKESEKGVASGYASLDASTLVPVAQLGTGTADSTKFLRGDRTWAVVTTHTHDGSGGATTVVIGGTAESGNVPTATTVGAIAIGDFANAGTGTQPIAIGVGANATAAPSATGQGSVAIGASANTTTNGARASGAQSVAIGGGTSGNQLYDAGAAATGSGGIAIGRASMALGNENVAIGLMARATTSTQVIAIGGGQSQTAAPLANAQGAIAIGASSGSTINGARASAANSVAIGSGNSLNPGASASGVESVSLGSGTTAFGARNVSIGAGASSGSDDSISIGAAAQTNTGTQAIAIGSGTNTTNRVSATAQGAIAIGSGGGALITGARASGTNSIAIGSGNATNPGALSSNSNTVAIGLSAEASGIDSVGIGAFTEALMENAVAIGRQASAQKVGSVGLGFNARAYGESGIAIGQSTYVDAAVYGGVAVGDGADVEGEEACAFGMGAYALQNGSTAIGVNTYVDHAKSTAIGNDATTTAANQIMLGTATEQVHFPGTLKIPTGAAAGKVLTSDAAGVGTWQTPSGGGGGGVSADTPVGGVVAYYGSTAPDGWLLCDGTAIPAQYTELIALVGANTPNFKGRVLVGRDAAQTEFDVLGETGGAKTHTLTSAEMPSHTHVQNAHTHEGFSGASPITQSGNGLVAGSGNPTVVSAGQIATGAIAVNQTTGSGGAHNNLQPYAVVNWIIKAEPASGSGGTSDIEPIVWMGGF